MDDAGGGAAASFSGRIVRRVYGSPDFSVYAMDVDAGRYPDIMRNAYGNVSISGDLPELEPGAAYEVEAEEERTKHGPGYRVAYIEREAPSTRDGMRGFLRGILTERQADALWEAYPDIVGRVREGRLGDVDLRRLDGIGPARFESIKKKISDNYGLADMYAEFRGMLPFSAAKRLRDRYASADGARKALEEDPYGCLCGLPGIGFKRADAMLLAAERLRGGSSLAGSAQRCRACMACVLKENEKAGNTVMNLADLRAACMDAAPECAGRFGEAAAAPEIYCDRQAEEASLRKTRAAEEAVAEAVAGCLGSGGAWECDAGKYRDAGGERLTDAQAEALLNVCRHRVSILNGAAGTGKTRTVRAVVAMLEDMGKSFALLAPTGKAAKVLEGYAGRRASTIHRELWPLLQRGRDGEPGKLDYDAVVIDEFSMVGTELFRMVLEALDLSRTRVLLIGDDAQLPSVSCGNLLHDFLDSGLVPSVTLDKVFRYGEGGLMKAASCARARRPYLGRQAGAGPRVFGTAKDYCFIETPSEDVPARARALYGRLLAKGYGAGDIQVLTAQNKGPCGAAALNAEIQKAANPNYGRAPRMEAPGAAYYAGDVVLQKSNWYHAKPAPGGRCGPLVANGETGTVLDASESGLVVGFGDERVYYSREDASEMLGLGYAVTIHKSQGSSSRIVILCTPSSHAFMLTSNLLYVGLTRAEERVFHLGSARTVDSAVRRKADFERRTSMKKLLAERAGAGPCPE